MRRNPFFLRSAAGFFLLMATCASAEAFNIRFTILPEKTEYTLSEPIEVRFKLENQGASPLFVNVRFKLGPKDAPKDQREIFLQAKGPSGQALPCKYPAYPTGFPKSDYFQLLQPHGEVISEGKIDLKSYFDFKEPGIYHITAMYENAYGQELGLDVFQKGSTAEISLKINP